MEKIPTENQRLGDISEILDQVRMHALTDRGIIHFAQNSPHRPEAQLLLEKIPARLITSMEDLASVEEQLKKLRALAVERNYRDVLEVLDEQIPYNRGYL